MSSQNAGMGIPQRDNRRIRKRYAKASDSGDGLDIGFAKLQGLDFDYCMHFYEIFLGRNTKKEKVDLDLTVVGGAKDISRCHARIYYDFKHHIFALEVLGKSGCYVQQVLYLPGDDPVKLESQDLIQIGGIQFYFLASSSRPIDESIAAQGTTYSYTFRGITYHVDRVTGVVDYTLPSQPMYATTSAHRHTHIPSQPMATTASAQHTPIPSQPMATTASAHKHTPIPSQPMSTTASAQHTPIPSQPMANTASSHKHTPIPSQTMSATASGQHTHIPSQPMSATASGQHTHIPSQPISLTACAQHTHIPSKSMNSSSMHPVHPNVSALRHNSHGSATGDNGTVIGTGTQRTFMKQNNRSLVGLDLNLEPIVETLEEDENAHGCANGEGGIIVGTGIQETNVEKNNRSFGELDLNVEPIGTLSEDVENGHGLAKGDGGIIVSAGTQAMNIEQTNKSFGELDLNVEPIGTLDEHGRVPLSSVKNGHDLANGESGIIVGTGTQGMFMKQINMSLGELSLNVEPTGTLGELNLNVGPTGTLGEHVDKVEISTDKDTVNQQLRQKEENDLMSSVASIVSNHPSPNGWVPAAEVHAELVKHFSKIWPSSTVQKYLVPEAGSSTGAVEKPWHKLLELLRKCPEKFVTCSISRGTETSDFVGFLHPPVLS